MVSVLATEGRVQGLLLVSDRLGEVGTTVRQEGKRVTAVGPGTSVTAEMPCTGGGAAVVLDGPVLEVAGDAGLLTVSLGTAPGPVRPDGDDVEWWSLGG